MVGPYDLSGSMGLTGRFDHPDFIAAMQSIQDACTRHGANMGVHIVEPNPAELAERVKQGYRFIAYGIDALFLWRNAQRPANG
jgi:2-dehydro-3-deoxyglucarate aldolase